MKLTHIRQWYYCVCKDKLYDIRGLWKAIRRYNVKFVIIDNRLNKICMRINSVPNFMRCKSTRQELRHGKGMERLSWLVWNYCIPLSPAKFSVSLASIQIWKCHSTITPNKFLRLVRLLTCIQKCSVRNFTKTLTVLNEFFPCVSESLQANADAPPLHVLHLTLCTLTHWEGL
jgi:hypothetical protein